MGRVKQILEGLANLSLIVLTVVVLTGRLPVVSGSGSGAAPQDPNAPTDPEAAHVTAELPSYLPIPSQRVVLLEFFDFQCPYCDQFDKRTVGELETQLVQTGRLEYVPVHFPLDAIHPDAVMAAQAAECANAHGKFRDMRKLLFANAQQLAQPNLIKFAAELGISKPIFASCLSDESTKERVRQHINLAESVGVVSTPTIMVGVAEPNSRRIRIQKTHRGAVSFSAIAATVEAVAKTLE